MDDKNHTKDTWFAPAERVTENELEAEIRHLSDNAIISSLLEMHGGVLAVLNKCRQVVAVNTKLLELLGVEDPASALSLRPGELMHCVHAHDHPGGCGTSRFCATCGAAIAIVSALADNEVVERDCILTINNNMAKDDLFLKVRACPVTVCEETFILLFINDMTVERQRASMEKVFFHDVNNLVMSLQGVSTLFAFQDEGEMRKSGAILNGLIERLAKEIQVQRRLNYGKSVDFELTEESVSVIELLDVLDNDFMRHTSRKNIGLTLEVPPNEQYIKVDKSLLLRALDNLVLNALEASHEGDVVKVSVIDNDTSIAFRVWNPAYIPDKVQLRLFQRHFSTKNGFGRGLGTYSVKLIVETYLRGKVSFRSNKEEGTEFNIWLPKVNTH